MFNLEKKFAQQLIATKCSYNLLSVARFFFQWKDSIRKGESPIIKRRPWMTFQSIDFLGKNLIHGSNVFEYGGGGSTLYCLDRGANVVTVEHDIKWFWLLDKKIQEDNLSQNWKGILKEPTRYPELLQEDPSNPELYISDDKKFKGFWFRDYASSIDFYPDLFFDFVLVDGRSRPSCIKHSVAKVKIGGFLLLDNTERNYYLSMSTKKYLEHYRVVLDEFGPTLGVSEFTKTTIWQRFK